MAPEGWAKYLNHLWPMFPLKRNMETYRDLGIWYGFIVMVFNEI